MGENLYGLIYKLWFVGRNIKHEYSPVKTCVSVYVRSELDSVLLQEVHHLILRVFLCAIEGHVLKEMGQSQLVFILHYRAGLDHQPQIDLILGISVGPYVVCKSVGKPADSYGTVRKKNCIRRDISIYCEC